MDATPYADDPTIPGDASLLRRIPPNRRWKLDPSGRILPNSDNFDEDDTTPMSVAIEAEILARGGGPTDVLAGHEGFGLVAFPAAVPRANGHGVCRWPTPEEPAHAYVFCLRGSPSRSQKKAIARACRWIRYPADCPAPPSGPPNP